MMERIPSRNLSGIFAFAFLLMQVFHPAAQGRAGLRKVKVGESVPEFSSPDSNGGTFTYKHDRRKVLALAFLPTSQRRMERTLSDIEKVLDSLRENNEQLHFIGIVSGPLVKDFLVPRKPGKTHTFPVLLDGDFQLWGRLGMIAAPTIIIVGKDDKILWIKAGYGYDFVPVVRARLKQALGIAQETTPEDAQQVKTVTNDTIAARIQRHLQMAKMLEKKGRVESAIGELQKAAKLDPNSIEPTLELGGLFCRAGRNKEALNLVEKLRTTKKADKARRLLISGWARRQMGELETAEKLLLEAIKLDPTSIRALFELGKIYQANGQTEKAMKSYYAALSLLFDESEGTDVSKEWQK
jgi:tetratricopeptide (TPR) repeat protein